MGEDNDGEKLCFTALSSGACARAPSERFAFSSSSSLSPALALALALALLDPLDRHGPLVGGLDRAPMSGRSGSVRDIATVGRSEPVGTSTERGAVWTTRAGGAGGGGGMLLVLVPLIVLVRRSDVEDVAEVDEAGRESLSIPLSLSLALSERGM